MNNRIEFKITSDSQGQEVRMDDMPIEVASALNVFMGSLTEIAVLQHDSSQVKISLYQNGNATAGITAPDFQFAEIERSLDDVINYRSNNSEYVKAFREVQKKIVANGLGYEVSLIKDGNAPRPLTNKFKDQRIFRVTKNPQAEEIIELRFIKGKLLASGGKNPNIHIDMPHAILPPINCTEEQAKRISSFLYNEVLICAWRSTRGTAKPKYYLCDHYVNEDLFNTLRDFVELNKQTNGLDRFHQIHDKLVQTISEQGLSATRKIIRLFKHESVESGKLRTILITLKSFKDSPELQVILEELATILREQLGTTTI